MRRGIFILFLLSVMPLWGQAFVKTGNALLPQCRTAARISKGNYDTQPKSVAEIAQDTADQAECVGYVAGTADTLTGLLQLCIPAGVTNGQLVELVDNWLETHPERRELPAALLIGAVLERAYVCH